jgi:hypothetical protein
VNNGVDDPLWRKTAYWCVIAGFFGTPVVMVALHLLLWNDRQTLRGEFHYIVDYHRVLAALLGAMLGLNSWDRRNGAKNGAGAKKA